MIYLLAWFAAAIVLGPLVGRYLARNNQPVTVRVAYPDPTTTSESSGGGDNQEWDGAEPTGPDPRP